MSEWLCPSVISTKRLENMAKEIIYNYNVEKDTETASVRQQ